METAPFVPDTFEVPSVLETDRFRLRMLSVADVEKDYEAVMETQAYFHSRGSSWPREGFTIEENLADLERHQQEFLERKAFAYTVVSLDEGRVLGCIYINPTDREGADARVHMWVRKSEYERGLDPVLFQTVKEWLKSSWPFSAVIYPGREQGSEGVSRMRDLLLNAAERAVRYRENLHGRSVVPTPEALQRLDVLDELLPEGPTDPGEVLSLLDEIGSPATMATAGGRFFGFVVGGSLPATVAASWLATAWDQEGGQTITAPVGARLESVCARWLVDLFSLPTTTGVGFVTGATMANFSGLAAARHALLGQEGWDVERDGLFGAPPITVVVGEEVHVSVLKALSLLGLGRDRVKRVPSDDQGRMRAEDIPNEKGPMIVCAQVGHVATGACDPVEEICANTKQSNAWVHVDGAFGMWAAVSPTRAHLVNGLQEADSWTVDAHKWLNVPYDSGLVFVRQEADLRAAMSISAAYLTPTENREPDAYVPEMSRRARGVEVWAALKSLGREGLVDLIERSCQQAACFADGLQCAGYQVLNEVVLNQVLVSFGADEVTQRVIDSLQQEGTCWCGGTVHQGRRAMRISISSWATTDEDCQRSLDAMLRAAAKVK